MRSLTKSLVGGVLATLLMLSSSPAQAFNLNEPTSDAELTVPGGDTAADAVQNVEVDGGTDEVDDVDGVDGVEVTDGVEGAAGSEDIDAAESVDDVEVEAPEVEAPEIVSSKAESEAPAEEGADDAAPKDVEEVDTVTPQENPGEFTEVPATFELNGRVVVLADEHNPSDSSEASGGGVLIATDEGAFVRVDQKSFGSALQPDDQFAGTATLPETARAAVRSKLSEVGSVSESEVLEALVEAGAEADTPLPVIGSVAPAPDVSLLSGSLLGAAPSSKAHLADVVYFTDKSSSSSHGKRAFTQTQLSSLVTQTGSYWKTQSNGAVPSLKLSRYKTLNTSYGACSQSALWTQAAQAFGANSRTYTNGRHLIVFVDSKYNCGLAGLADIGTSLHAGGVIWVDLGAYGGRTGATSANQTTVNKSLTTLAHEAGHNMSLGHAQSRDCTGKTTDAKTAWSWDDQNPGTLKVKKPTGTACTDVEYGNTWNLMGLAPTTSKPASLGIDQRAALGVNPSGSVKTVQAKGGRSQTFTLNAVGTNTGLRGLKISNAQGENFYVEYRRATGQDSQGVANGSFIRSSDARTIVTPGVLVTKSYPTGQYKQGTKWVSYPVKRSTALTNYKTTGSYANSKHLALEKGGVSTPIDSVARVRVVSTSGTSAKVKIEFTPFVDIAYNHKFVKEINWMKSAKLSTGISAGNGLRKYDPKAQVSRQAMAVFLYGMSAPKNYKPLKKSPFKDVSTKHKYYKQISWMYTSGLSTGVKVSGGRKFAPSSSVTRESTAVFLYRLKGTKYKGAATSPYSDVKKGQKYYKQLTWMKAAGITSGVKQKSGKPKYNPKGKVTRESMAAFIYRFKH